MLARHPMSLVLFVVSVFAVDRYAEMEDMVKCQLAMSTISAAEGLKISEAEFEAEYQSVVAEFGEKEAEFDDAKLREQVTETLQVCSLYACLDAVYMLPQSWCICEIVFAVKTWSAILAAARMLHACETPRQSVRVQSLLF